MLDWKEIEKTVFANYECNVSCRGEMLAIYSLSELKKQFDKGEISKEKASALKSEIKAKYEGLNNILALLPELINMICTCEWGCEYSDEFAKLLYNEFNALQYKTNQHSLYQKLGIAVFEYYDDRVKEIKPQVKSEVKT